MNRTQVKRLLFLLLVAAVALFAQEGGGEAAEGAEGGMMLWKWANFLILAGGLGFLIAKNLPAYFASRTAEIQKGIAEAQAAKKDAERRSAEVDTRVKSLASEIEAFRAKARSEMEQEGERIRQETAAQVKKMEQQAAAEIESAGKVARRELKTYAGELALSLAEQRIRERLDAQTEGELVANFLGDLKQQGTKN